MYGTGVSSQFPKRLREALAKRGWTQERLGEAVGVKQTTIAYYLMGRRPKRLLCDAMAKALAVSPEWLWDGTGSAVPLAGGTAMRELTPAYGDAPEPIRAWVWRLWDRYQDVVEQHVPEAGREAAYAAFRRAIIEPLAKPETMLSAWLGISPREAKRVLEETRKRAG